MPIDKHHLIPNHKADSFDGNTKTIIETMAAELERLRPMEVCLELAEADRDSYKKRVEELEARNAKLEKEFEWIKHSYAMLKCYALGHERELKRALWLARASRANTECYAACGTGDIYLMWDKVKDKCLAMAERFK